VKGFPCEAHAIEGARDITAFGSWEAWLTLSAKMAAVAQTDDVG